MTSTLVLPDATVWVRLEEDSGVGAARRAGQQLAERLGFPEPGRSELAVAVTELATNVVRHAGHGTVVLRPLREVNPPGIEVVALDQGPGIRDVAAAMADGFSTAGTLGIGLGAVARFADTWDVYSRPGAGTVVCATYRGGRPRGAPGPRQDVAALVRPMTGESEVGDAYAVRHEGSVRSLLLVDGLGHGPLAAQAARAAVRLFGGLPAGTPPGEALAELHRGLARTRGAAAAVVGIDGDSRGVRFAGIGNVSAFVVAPDQRRGMVSLPGILGQQVRAVREYGYDLPYGAAVVLHTDGVSDKWSPNRYPSILSHLPPCLGGVLLRDFGVRRDDAGVLVATVPSP